MHKTPAEETRFKLLEAPVDRLLTVKSGDIDEEKRTVCFTFSSDTPIDRPWGREVLSHERGAVKTERINKKGAVLVNHDPDKQVGCVLECGVIDGKGKAIAKFSRNKEGQEIFNDIVDGIRENISVRYQIHDYAVTEGERDGEADLFTINNWEILELSVVSIPADHSIGVGRSLENTNKNINLNKEILAMEVEGATAKEEEKKPEEVKKVAFSAGNDDVLQKERARVKEINEYARSFGKQNLAEKYVEEGKSPDEFRKAILNSMGDAMPVQTQERSKPVEVSGITTKEARSFSMCKAIMAQATGDWAQAGLEREIITATKKAIGRDSRDGEIHIPMDVMSVRSGNEKMMATSSGMGQEFVAEDLRGDSFIELLKSKLFTRELGAKFLSNLSSNVALPKQTSAAKAEWVQEGQGVTRSRQGTDKVQLSPKTVSANTDYTRRFLIQSSIDVERWVREDITQQIALAIDEAATYGAENGPSGIISQIPQANKIIANASALTFEQIVEMETAVESANANVSPLSYVCGAKLKGKLKTTQLAENTPGFLWNVKDNGFETMNGYRSYCTNIIGYREVSGKILGTLLLGAWDQLIIGSFGVLSILVDPYSLSDENSIRIVASQEVDTGVRHPHCFAICEDALIATVSD